MPRLTRKPIEVTINGEPWLIKFRYIADRWGQTYWDKREIHIDPRVYDSVYVKASGEDVTPREIVLHEVKHAHMRWMDEDFVDVFAREEDSILDDLDL